MLLVRRRGAIRNGGATAGFAVCTVCAMLATAFATSLVAPVLGAVPTPAALHTPTAMALTVHADRACFGTLPPPDRRLLALRFGVGGRPVQTDAAVAARLGLTPAEVFNREVLAVRRLANARRYGACKTVGRVASAASSSGVSSSASGSPGVSGSPGSSGSPGVSSSARSSSAVPPTAVSLHHSGGGIAVDEIVAIAVIVACLIVVGREFHKAIFAPPPRT